VQEGGHHAPSHEQHTASAAPATTASDVELTSHHGNEQASSSKSAKAPSSNEEGSLRKKQSRRNANPWLALPLFIAGLGVLWLARRTRNKKQSTGATRARSATAARSPAKSKAGAGSPASKRKGSSRAAATSKDAAAASVVAGAEDQGAPQAEEEVVEPALPDSFTIRASDAAIAPAPPPPAPLAPPPLNGLVSGTQRPADLCMLVGPTCSQVGSWHGIARCITPSHSTHFTPGMRVRVDAELCCVRGH
jgi:hypothetical protein